MLGIGVGMIHGLSPSAVIGPKSLSPALYTAYVAGVTANGGTMSATEQSAALQLARDLISNGLDSRLDAVYLLPTTINGRTATQRYNQARTNLIVPGTFDATVSSPNAGGHTGSGIQFNGAMYLDTGFAPSTNAAGRGHDLSIFAVAVALVQEAKWDSDDEGGGGDNLFATRFSDNSCFFQLNGLPTLNPANPSPMTAALFVASRTASAMKGYRNGTQLATGALGSEGLTTRSLLFGCGNNGTPNTFSTKTFGVFGIGRGLSAAEVSALYTCLQTYLAAFGVTI